MSWNGSTEVADRVYTNDDKQEAYEFLSRDIDARPLARGMDSLKRIDAWLRVVERFNPDEDTQKKEVKTILQDRRGRLVELRRDSEFVDASELRARDGGDQRAVADGGATFDETNDEADDDLYGNAAERESKTRKAYQKARTFETVEAVQEALQEEWSRDTRRRHVVDALEKRLGEVGDQ